MIAWTGRGIIAACLLVVAWTDPLLAIAAAVTFALAFLAGA